MAKRERKVSFESYHIDDFQLTKDKEILEDLDNGNDDDQLFAEEIKNAPTFMDTPIGIIRRDDSLNPFRQMHFFMLNTNFDIRAREFIITNFADGVEAVKPISRYRLLVGFGKMFEGKEKIPYEEVRKELTEALIKADDYPEELYKRQRRILTNSSNIENN